MDAKTEKIALFRYGLIAPLVLRTLPRGELTRRAVPRAPTRSPTPNTSRFRSTSIVLWYRSTDVSGHVPQN
jgi:hypothetical protein